MHAIWQQLTVLAYRDYTTLTARRKQGLPKPNLFHHSSLVLALQIGMRLIGLPNDIDIYTVCRLLQVGYYGGDV